MEQKMKISQQKSKYYNGYKWPRSTNISPGESVDVKETVSDASCDLGVLVPLTISDGMAIFSAI
jgi:hypothetical protein